MKANGDDIRFMERYLKKALELEKLKFSFGNACQNVKGTCNKLSASVSNLEERSQNYHDYLAKTDRREWIKSDTRGSGTAGVKALIVGIALLLLLVLSITKWADAIEGAIIPIVFWCGGGGMVALGIAISNFKKKAGVGEDKLYDAHIAKINTEMMEVDEVLLPEKNKLIHYNSQHTTLVDQYTLVCKELEEHYALGVLHPSYCNFVTVGTLYGYISKGICTTVRGHGGIYDTYEYHLKMNLIITKLDTIISRLDAIASHQQELCIAIKEGNQISRQICSEIQAGNKLTQEQLDAYRQERYERSVRGW